MQNKCRIERNIDIQKLRKVKIIIDDNLRKKKQNRAIIYLNCATFHVADRPQLHIFFIRINLTNLPTFRII
jgi:hypothetical protein